MKPKQKPGPKPEYVKIDVPWEKAIQHALNKPRPKDGWPLPDAPKKSPSDKKSKG